jgi:hypothetical protein
MCLVNSVRSNIGHFVKYFRVLSANYLRPFPDFSHREYFAKIAPINNTFWSAFSMNRVKMLNINTNSEEVLKILKIISGSPPDPDLFKHAKTGPKYLVRMSLSNQIVEIC